MLRKLIIASLLATSSAFASLPAVAAEPSLHEVYQAADAGRLEQAQGMMQEVLRAHPNSGKAHFVEAELLAKQGQFQKARDELAAAEKLAPGLSFAKPQAVENLKSLLRSEQGSASAAKPQPVTANTLPASAPTSQSFPWTWLLGGLGLLAFIAWAARFLGSRQPTAVPFPAGGAAAGYSMSNQSWNPGYGAPTPASAGSGLGSRLMGGLATGAAVGAGVVAGEAIARHFLHDDDEPSRRTATNDNTVPTRDTYFNDLGGNDFGVSDTSSWDDGGSSGDSDWN